MSGLLLRRLGRRVWTRHGDGGRVWTRQNVVEVVEMVVEARWWDRRCWNHRRGRGWRWYAVVVVVENGDVDCLVE